MSAVPPLPKEISPDGREIWDWAAKLSSEVYRRDEISKLAVRIRNAETQCGSCADWMTRSCPRETHSNKTGRSTGPSSQAIKCEQFRMTACGSRELEAAKAKLDRLNSNDRAAIASSTTTPQEIKP